MALDFLAFLRPEAGAGVGSFLLKLGIAFIYAVVIGGLVGGLLVILLRALSFRYRAIIIERRASGGIAISVDRAKIKRKKEGEVKTIFANRRKGSFEELPYKYVFPTVKKGFFDLLVPKDTFFVFSYAENEYLPVDVAEDFGKFKFEAERGTANFWADLERKNVRQKYGKKGWLAEHAGILIVSATLITGMIIILVMMMISIK